MTGAHSSFSKYSWLNKLAASSLDLEQVNDMKLHPAPKEDIKEILLKAMVQIVIVHETNPQIPKTQGFFLRMLQKTTN